MVDTNVRLSTRRAFSDSVSGSYEHQRKRRSEARYSCGLIKYTLTPHFSHCSVVLALEMHSAALGRARSHQHIGKPGLVSHIQDDGAYRWLVGKWLPGDT
jgi:hypothetical protein